MFAVYRKVVVVSDPIIDYAEQAEKNEAVPDACNDISRKLIVGIKSPSFNYWHSEDKTTVAHMCDMSK
jgi:hypothetical protein